MAGKAFCEAANLHSRANSRHDAATHYVDASNCYKKVDTQQAVDCLLKAIEIYTDMGRFTIAAKHHQTIAEIYENEANDLVSSTIQTHSPTSTHVVDWLCLTQQNTVSERQACLHLINV